MVLWKNIDLLIYLEYIYIVMTNVQIYLFYIMIEILGLRFAMHNI